MKKYATHIIFIVSLIVLASLPVWPIISCGGWEMVVNSGSVWSMVGTTESWSTCFVKTELGYSTGMYYALLEPIIIIVLVLVSYFIAKFISRRINRS
jgi:hypothetical protein